MLKKIFPVEKRTIERRIIERQAIKRQAIKRQAIIAIVIFVCVVTVFAPPAVYAQNQSQAETFYQAGLSRMAREQWYEAAESFLESLRLNQAHAGANASLAECYYALEEFDEALIYVRRARTFARSNLSLANLEGVTLIALGRLEEAARVINEVLAREPYNKEALFAAAELDIARGRVGDALLRYREAARLFPDDRRVLISLALILGSMGEQNNARFYIERALQEHPEDYRVYYYASYLDAQAGNLAQAIRYAQQSLAFRGDYPEARNLLASLRYQTGEYEEAARLADIAISANRRDVRAWYLKGISYIRQGRFADAISTLQAACDIDPNDEFIRSALEEQLIAHTGVENSSRVRWAAWHFSRAAEYKSRNLIDQALFEYRRGLRLNPYAVNRWDYAELLRIQKYPSRYLEELKFMQELGVESRTVTKASINNAIEIYDSLLADSLYRRWAVEQHEVSARHWKVAVFSMASQSTPYHTDAGSVGSSYIRDILVHERNIQALSFEESPATFSQAFSTARNAGADYFLVITINENERDLSIEGELFVARTGAAAGAFYAYRTGTDRLRNASRGIVEQLSASLPFRASLIRRRASQGLLDKGRADGAVVGAVYEVVKKGSAAILSEGIGLYYANEDIVGTFTVEQVDEEVCSGTLERNGFFDNIAAGDEVIFQPQKPQSAGSSDVSADPQLREFLRRLR
ncbi:hypothetical protein FACS1894151_01420 [Spirochaetia bacterium]|nr:hypothetical protein FACS1894151_01420 [Spirochaetia bacterium]